MITLTETGDLTATPSDGDRECVEPDLTSLDDDVLSVCREIREVLSGCDCDLLLTRERVNLICPWSEEGESQVKVRFLSWTGRPLSVTLDPGWSRQERDLLMLGRGDMKVPTRLAFPSSLSAPLACSRKESKLSEGFVVTMRTVTRFYQ